MVGGYAVSYNTDDFRYESIPFHWINMLYVLQKVKQIENPIYWARAAVAPQPFQDVGIEICYGNVAYWTKYDRNVCQSLLE